mmetsp:Transcript_1092/g.2441  ORF Transcript_1092/g.2441 Transcript_1092/m.2441 type:complete len:238 (+) Transcript_1092:286-999(+)
MGQTSLPLRRRGKRPRWIRSENRYHLGWLYTTSPKRRMLFCHCSYQKTDASVPMGRFLILPFSAPLPRLPWPWKLAHSPFDSTGNVGPLLWGVCRNTRLDYKTLPSWCTEVPIRHGAVPLHVSHSPNIFRFFSPRVRIPCWSSMFFRTTRLTAALSPTASCLRRFKKAQAWNETNARDKVVVTATEHDLGKSLRVAGFETLNPILLERRVCCRLSRTPFLRPVLVQIWTGLCTTTLP